MGEKNLFVRTGTPWSFRFRYLSETATICNNHWPYERVVNTIVHTALRCIISMHCPFQ